MPAASLLNILIEISLRRLKARWLKKSYSCTGNYLYATRQRFPKLSPLFCVAWWNIHENILVWTYGIVGLSLAEFLIFHTKLENASKSMALDLECLLNIMPSVYRVQTPS